MGILIKGTFLVQSSGKLEKKDVYLKEDKIESIANTLHAYENDKIIDGSNKLLVPGLANCHTHLSMTLLRGIADDIPLKQWLENEIWPVEEKLKPEDVYWGAMLGIAEMIKGGTTVFADMYFPEDEVARAVAETGIRACLAPGLIYHNPENGEKKLKENINFIKKWEGWKNLITTAFGPHALYTCPPEYIREIVKEAGKLNVLVHFHFLEAAWERDYCLKNYGLNPLDFFKQAHLFDTHTLIAHGVHLTLEESCELSPYKIFLAHNPTSNLKLSSGIAPISGFLKNGLKLVLGTDGTASNNDLDMWEEGRLMSFIQKGVSGDPTVLNAKQSYKIMTENGYYALKLKGGKIEEGYLADLILIDLNAPHLTPIYNGFSHLVYVVHPEDVKTTIVGGKILMHDRELLTIDEEKVLGKVRDIARRLKQ